MSSLRLMTDAVQRRANAVLVEITLTDDQIRLIGRVPGTVESDRTNLIHMRDVKAALYLVYIKYLEQIRKVCKQTATIRDLIKAHLAVIRSVELEILLCGLYGHRSALETRFGSDYDRVTNDLDEAMDRHLEMILVLYPYEFVVEMLSQTELVEMLLRMAIEYKACNHIRAVSEIFGWIKRFRAKSSEAQRSYFFTARDPMCFALAEQFLSFFVRGKMLNADWSDIRNFSVSERCVMIAKHGVLECGVGAKTVEELQRLGRKLEEEVKLDELEYAQPLPGNELADDVCAIECDIRELRHIIFELKKMPLQTSPSTMLHVLSNAIQWLKAALFQVNGHEVGADEMMPFFVYCLSVSKPSFLPSMITFVARFVDGALKETSFSYYIEQLRSALGFIEMRLFPIQPYVVFPFRVPPKRLRGVLKNVGEEPLVLHGFEVWAFPTYSRMSDITVPAVFRYAGSDDIAKGYQFEVISFEEPLVTDPGLEAVPTFVGTFIECSTSLIAQNEMIKVEGGDYVNSAPEIADISAMTKMLGGKFEARSTAVIDNMYELVQEKWKKRGSRGVNILAVVTAIQEGLTRSGLLTEGEVTGVLDAATWEAIRVKASYKHDKFILTPKIYDAIGSTKK